MFLFQLESNDLAVVSNGLPKPNSRIAPKHADLDDSFGTNALCDEFQEFSLGGTDCNGGEAPLSAVDTRCFEGGVVLNEEGVVVCVGAGPVNDGSEVLANVGHD